MVLPGMWRATARATAENEPLQKWVMHISIGLLGPRVHSCSRRRMLRADGPVVGCLCYVVRSGES